MSTREPEQEDDAMHHAIDSLDERLHHDLSALRTSTEERLPSLAETERRLRDRLRRHDVTRRRLIVAGGLAAACSTALAAPLLFAPSAPSATTPRPAAVAAEGRTLRAGDASGPPASMGEARARRDALRRAIVRHAPASAAAAQPANDVTAAKAHEADRAAADSKRASNEQPHVPHFENKMGRGREKLGQFLNEAFAPLMGECIEQAAARTPALTGMYAIGIETLADADLGAVVDVADPASRNEIADPLFLECVRESAFSLVFPPPLTSGQEKFEITGYFGDPPAGDEAPRRP